MTRLVASVFVVSAIVTLLIGFAMGPTCTERAIFWSALCIVGAIVWHAEETR